MTEKVYNVMFLCTGNSARSIMAERLVERLGQGRFRGFSAGSHPRGEVHPLALEILRCSKDWSEFAKPDAPQMDFVFTVCDNAAAEVCPVWPTHPISAHWGVVDPAAVEGDEMERMMASRTAFRELQNRISAFVNLPLASLDKLRLREKLQEISRTTRSEEDAETPAS